MIICVVTVMVALDWGGGLIANETQLQGKIIKEGKYAYIIDFSKDPQIDKYYGDYSKKLVTKDKCVKL